jgi:two-component system, response regulator YesN
MIGVYVVDDEKVTRDFFREKFDWEPLDMRWIGEAGRGDEALEECRHLKPDLVLVDISMPGIDGLEFVRRLCEGSPRSRCIILTCHQDFTYAQTALRLGCLDYLVKAFTTPKEMIEKFSSCHDRLIRERLTGTTESAIHQWAADLLLGRYPHDTEIHEVMRNLDIPLTLSEYMVMVFGEFSSERPIPEADDSKRDVENRTPESVLRSVFSEVPNCVWTIPNEHTHACIINTCINFRGMHALVRETVDGSARVVCAVSGVKRTYGEAPEAYSEALRALESEFYLGNADVLMVCADWNKLGPDIEAEIDGILHDSAESQRYRRYSGWLRATIELCRTKWIDPVQTRALIAEILVKIVEGMEASPSFCERTLWKVQAQAWRTAEQLQSWAEQILISFFSAAGKRVFRPEVQRVIDDIEDTLPAPYELSRAAEVAHLHPNYFCSLFTRETGQTFIEYVNAMRIGKAVQYMREGVYKMYQVAEMVGIPNYRTFYNTFLRHTGMTPTEFCEKL